MIKGSVQEKDTTIVNIYSPNIGASQCIRQTLTDIKGEIDSNTIIVGDFNTPLTPMNRWSKQEIKKETQVLNYTLDEMDLMRLYWYLQDIPSKGRRIHLLLKCTENILQDRPTSWVTNQTSVNLRKLKLFQAPSLTTMLWN